MARTTGSRRLRDRAADLRSLPFGRQGFRHPKLTWTLVANGQPAVVSFYLHPDYNLNFYKEEANGNEPPRLKFAVNDRMRSGPIPGIAQTLSGRVGQPVPLRLWTADARPTEKNWETIVSAQNRPTPQPIPRDQVAIVNGQVIGGAGSRPRQDPPAARPADITVRWTTMRGPGRVTFTPAEVPLVTNGNRDTVVEAAATATFSAPGEYLIRAEPVEADDGFRRAVLRHLRQPQSHRQVARRSWRLAGSESSSGRDTLHGCLTASASGSSAWAGSAPLAISTLHAGLAQEVSAARHQD